jgi:hypothetical protein
MILWLNRITQRNWTWMAGEPAGGGPIDGSATPTADPPGDGSSAPSSDADAGSSLQDIAAEEYSARNNAGPTTPPDGNAPVPPAAPPSPAGKLPEAPAAPVQGAEVLQQFGLDVKDPAIAGALAPKLQEVRQWAVQTQVAYQDVVTKYNQLVGYVQELQAGKPANGQPGQPGAGQPPKPNEPPPEFETPVEEKLWNQVQGMHQSYESLRGQYDQLSQQLSQVLQKQQGHEQLVQHQESERQIGEITKAEQVLAPKFPTLFKDGQMDQSVHKEALSLWDAALQAHIERGMPLPSVQEVLERACKLLDYDQVGERAVQTHTETLRKNARTYTLPGSTNGGSTAAPATLAGVAEEEAASRGLI